MVGITGTRRVAAVTLLAALLVLHCAAADETAFVCDGGATRLPPTAVDDDYCDCADGSDEPHTAACARGHFVCANAGYLPQRLPSAFVNDGVCDCCDGSDEWAAPGACNNTCAALAAARRAELHALRRAAEAGLALQAAWAPRGAAERAHADARSSVLAQVLADARTKRQAVADAEQRLGRTLPRSAVVVVRAGAQGTQDNATDAVEAGEGVHVDVAAAEAAVRAEMEAEEKKEKEKEEEVVAQDNETAAVNATVREALEHAWEHATRAVVHAWHWVLCKVARQDESCRVLEQENEEDGTGSKHAAYSEALQCIDEYTRELEDERRALEALTELALNDAPCYYVVAQECSEAMMPTGMFKACPFHNVSMAHRTLGRWQRPESGSVVAETMEFANGDYSWDCPKRTGRLQFVCGDANTLVSMKEPTKCTFEGVFATPCACTPQHIANYTAELALLPPEPVSEN